MRKLLIALGLALTVGLTLAQDTGGMTGGEMTGGEATGGSSSGAMMDDATGGATGGMSDDMTGGAMDDTTGGATGGSDMASGATGGSATGGATGGSATGGATDSSTSLAEESGSIADIVAGDPQFSTLLQALSAAGLAEELGSDGPFTVLAPTDEAFSALSSSELDALLSDPEQLANVLQTHVISGEYNSEQLSGFPAALTLTGEEIPIESSSSGLTIGGVNVTSADIEATNGIIHVIDAVLLPSSMTEQSSSTGGSSTGGSTGGSTSSSTGGSSTGGSSTGGEETGGQ